MELLFKDPYFPSDTILKEVKMTTYLETGYVYAPYVPAIITPLMEEKASKRLKKAGIKVVPKTLVSDEDFVPRPGILTRYGKKALNPSYYGSIKICE